jgi:transcriptional regulator with XRE-family HTH domain
MSIFYSSYISLCAKHNKSASKVAEEIGLSRASANGWRNGAMPSEVNLQKIADYFGVSVEYLKGETENPSVENKGVESKLPQSEDEETIKELYDLTKGLSKNDIALVKAFIAGVRANHEDG